MCNSKQYFGIDFKKIIVTGDSAGGNLAIGLTLMTINRDFRIPDGVFLAYPTCSVVVDKYWPSFLNALDDNILSSVFCNLVLRSYLP